MTIGILLGLACSPQIDLPARPPAVWRFEGASAATLAERLGDSMVTALSPSAGRRGGYAIYADGGGVALTRFNWHLMAVAVEAGVDSSAAEAYTAGALPNLGEAFEWALDIFAIEGLALPNTGWEPGFPPESREWVTWIEHLRVDKDDVYSLAVEAMAEGWLRAQRRTP